MNPITSIGKRGKAMLKKHIRRRRNSSSGPPSYDECSIYNEPPPPYTEFDTIANVTICTSPPPAYTPSETHTTPLQERLNPIDRNAETRTSGRSTASASSDQYCHQSPSASPELRRRSLSGVPSDPRSWTESLRWIAQYSLESNFRRTVQHFHSMVQRALRIKQRQEDAAPFLLQLDSIPTPPPTSLARQQWDEMVFGLGFEIPRCNSAEQLSADILPEYIIVPAKCNNTELVLYTIIFQGIMELPFNIVRMMAYLRKDEMDQILYLLSFVVSHPDHRSLSKEDYLIQPVWDLHRRPGCLLREMGFQEVYHSDGRRSVLFPSNEIKRQRIQLVTDILRTFQYGDTTRVILVWLWYHVVRNYVVFHSWWLISMTSYWEQKDLEGNFKIQVVETIVLNQVMHVLLDINSDVCRVLYVWYRYILLSQMGSHQRPLYSRHKSRALNDVTSARDIAVLDYWSCNVMHLGCIRLTDLNLWFVIILT